MFFFPHAAAAAAAEDNAAILARADARADTSKFLWLSIGCGTGAVGLYLLALARENLSYGEFISGGLIGAGPWLLSHVGNAPPSGRLLGKSPEYVNVYVAAYEEERHRIKRDWGSLGSLLGIVAGGIVVVSIVANQE